jgi:integrase
MYLRKLPSGLWQCTVRGKDGKKHTKTDKLKSVVKRWGTEQEASTARGEWRDPRAGTIAVEEWYARVSRARAIDDVTKAKHVSLWATHCQPQWARWQMNAISRIEAQEWATGLAATPRARHQGKTIRDDDTDVPTLGAETVAAAVHLMSQLYTMAMREVPPIVTVNPFAALELPSIQPHAIDFFEHDEAEALLDAIEELSGRAARTLTELGMWVGLRPGELYGLHGHRVNWLRGTVEVIDVMTRSGLRQWPKSRKSHRVVPVPKFVSDGMAACMTGRPGGSLVFTAPEGGPMSDANFRTRIWYPGIARAGVRPLPPKCMRHTAASWLVQDGVPLYDVQALLGHESFRTTERYAHLVPDAHVRVLKSWAGRMTNDAGARVAHGDGRRM